MMANAIAQYLTEFHLDPARDVEPVFPTRPSKTKPEEKVEDTAGLLRAAEERGREEGRALARRELETAISMERANADQRVVEARAAWTQEEAARLASQVTAAFQDLEARLTDSLARLLTPFLNDAIRQQALEEFRGFLLTLLSDSQNTVFKVSGPEDMLSELAKKLGSPGASIQYVYNERTDVSVVVNDTVIETQLTAWTSRLAEAVRPS